MLFVDEAILWHQDCVRVVLSERQQQCGMHAARFYGDENEARTRPRECHRMNGLHPDELPVLSRWHK